jgi:hypothetical protein
VEKAMVKARLVFNEDVAGTIYGNLRSLSKEVRDSAVDLIEEFYREGYEAGAPARPLLSST